MAITNPTARDLKKSLEYMGNLSFDPLFEVNSVELLGYNPDAGTLNRIKVNADGELLANLEAGDIQIGAVEIKNSTDDTRATVGANGLYVDVRALSSAITGTGHGVTTVTTAGTDVVLASSTTCKRVIIQSQTDNTSLIAVGATGVDATIATGTGVVLYPGDSVELEIDNLADIYIDSLVNGEGVRYQYFT